MSLLDGKTGLVVGLSNYHSLAWGISRALHDAGADLGFTYRSPSRERRAAQLAADLNARLVARCDVRSDDDIAALMAQARAVYGALDIIVHAPAAADPADLRGPYFNTTRAGFLLALEVNAYSLTALVKAALATGLLNDGAAIVTLTYVGSQQVVPNYNVSGVAKAALEASVRYLAADLGPRNIRVNAISAGPIRTLSASGIGDFRHLHHQFPRLAPLRRHVTIEDVGKTALWLCSDLASAVTGETIYVDAGAHYMANVGLAAE
ncbi:MAG: enoyl-ACP reductase FabI [Thermomicrobiales bacterium]